MEGGLGKEKDIIGSSAQGFGTDLGNHHSRCWTPELGMLPAFLDEPDLGNVTSLLKRTGLENIARLQT
ncbi:hypothetical protein RclHR1_20840004 [Rhizophagus clarus]|uniref:Uncharacterized protein n=1 Tax=Rhizophagus clarus TaxID=94130 RepID=A0A2Z6QTY1_9GLOM|nr:hypothetical protein RclHR1_20840004 [Rhizophagus clarus]